MELGSVGVKLASAAVAPLVRRLFAGEGPGAGLVDRPIRISGRLSFRGEKRSLTEADVRSLAAELVRRAVSAGERPVEPDEERAVADALGATLYALGDLTLTDLAAVRLGHREFARRLRRAAGRPERELSAEATYFHESLVDTACLHILQFFTQRSTFVAHALVEQARHLDELVRSMDELLRRTPLPEGQDASFEERYRDHLRRKHGRLTIHGIDLRSPARWPLDAGYLSLEATGTTPAWLAARPVRDGRAATAPHAEAAAPVPGAPGAGRDGRHPAYALGTRLRAGCDLPAGPGDQPPAGPDEAGEARPPAGSATGPARLGVPADVSWDSARPADQALATDRRVLLRGEAGSGKSTLVQWLAVTAARGDLGGRYAYLYGRVPFVLPLRTLTRDGGRLPAPRAFLSATGCPLAGAQPDGWEDRVLAAGRGLVLVDGIDEVPEGERERARTWLRDLVETYDGDNRWLVTSRPSAVRHDWLAEEDFAELTMSAMSAPDIAGFIRRWHAAARSGAAEDDGSEHHEARLLAAVRTHPDLGRLATNPLMCGLVCALHRDRHGYLPHAREDLYEAALSMLLGRRDRERDVAAPALREEPQREVLQRLAYWLIKNGRTEMDRSRAESIVGRALPGTPELAALGEAPAVFEHLLQRSGLLREPVPGTVDFVHRSFQDFLGARAAVEEGDFGLLVEHADDDQWEDVIRMAVALARPRERETILLDLLARGERAPDARTRARIVLLAAACLEHATSLGPGTRDAVERAAATLLPPADEQEARALADVGPLILRLLPGPEELDDLAAYHTVIAASHVRSDAAVAYLSRFARHPFIPVRAQLLWAWARFDGRRYADEVVARLAPDGLIHTVRNDEQLGHLRRLGVAPERLDVRAGVSGAALSAYLEGHRVTSLSLRGVRSTDLRALSGQRELTTLTVRDCPGLVDLTGIGGLPLRHVDLTGLGARTDLGALGELPLLETLAVGGDVVWSPAELPAGAPLRSLRLLHDAAPRSGLRGLGAFPGLEVVAFCPASAPASAADWREVGALPALTELTTTAASLAALEPGGQLAAVAALYLEGGDAGTVQAALDRLPAAFPRLAVCEVAGDPAVAGALDVSALAGLRDLRVLHVPVPAGRVGGAGAPAPSVRLLCGRPAGEPAVRPLPG